MLSPSILDYINHSVGSIDRKSERIEKAEFQTRQDEDLKELRAELLALAQYIREIQ